MIAFVEAQEGAPPLLTMGACPYMSHSYSEDKEMTLRQGL
jgi:hydroxyethylthiazole kinase-like sugar kinase family protein